MKNLLFFTMLLFCFPHAIIVAQDTTWCEGSWKQALMGRDIGKNSMNSIDIDNDGLTEIVVHAESSSWYWYIMEYMPATGEYTQSWVSPAYIEGTISCIEVFDLDEDGDMEIILGLEAGYMEVWDGIGKTLQYSFKLPIPEGNYSDPEDMLLADADNDGSPELVISTYSHIFIFEASTLNYEGAWQYGGYNIACGNVDSNPDNELVISSGSLLRLNGDQMTLLWQFAESEYGFEWIGLIDCDADGMQEIFYEPYMQFVCYDADLQAVKYQQPDELTSISYVIADADNNGNMEILGSVIGYGYIYCIDPADGSVKWRIYNDNDYVNAITVADADNDGFLEMVWAEGNHLHVHDIATLQEEWVCSNMEGLFAVRIADCDDDGQLEILTITQSSGILTIWDEVTRQMEWQSNNLTFDSSIQGIYDFEVADIDNDGVTEIIVPGSVYYNANIWVMNGQTHQIESSHEYYNISSLGGFTIDDVNNDGLKEYIAVSGGHVVAIDPSDYSILWQAGSNIQASFLEVGNTDSDPAKEILTYGWGDIQCVDGITHAITTTSGEPSVPYSSVALYDIDSDGDQEIIAGTLDGKIGTLDGTSLSFTEWLPFNFGGNLIAGLRAADIQGNESPELVFFVGDILYFTNLSGEMKTFADIGSYNSAGSMSQVEIINDYDGDGYKEIFASSTFQLVEYNYDCYKCMNFFPVLTGEDVSCLSDHDGSVSILPLGGNEPYNFVWNNGSNAMAITNLVPGNYSITVTDSEGCTEFRETGIIQSYLEADAEVVPRGCEDHYGQISIDVTTGHPPYSYSWNGSADTTATLGGLEAGFYSVTVTDHKHCSEDLVYSVTQDKVDINLIVQPIICNAYGQILSEVNGYPPYNYSWSNGSGDANLYWLEEGSYTLTATDALACEESATAIIYNADNLTAVVITTPDTLPLPGGDGTAIIIPSGGVPPYQYHWEGIPSDSIINNLNAGYYYARVIDKYNCTFGISVYIDSNNGINNPRTPFPFPFNVYPNPTPGTTWIEFESETPESGYIELYSIQGTLMKSFGLEGQRTIFNTALLDQGLYYLKVMVGEYFKVVKLVVN